MLVSGSEASDFSNSLRERQTQLLTLDLVSLLTRNLVFGLYVPLTLPFGFKQEAYLLLFRQHVICVNLRNKEGMTGQLCPIVYVVSNESAAFNNPLLEEINKQTNRCKYFSACLRSHLDSKLLTAARNHLTGIQTSRFFFHTSAWQPPNRCSLHPWSERPAGGTIETQFPSVKLSTWTTLLLCQKMARLFPSWQNFTVSVWYCFEFQLVPCLYSLQSSDRNCNLISVIFPNFIFLFHFCGLFQQRKHFPFSWVTPALCMWITSGQWQMRLLKITTLISKRAWKASGNENI